MRFAVVGCGSIGKRHIGNLLQLGHEVVAYNRNKNRRDEVAETFGIPVADNLRQVLHTPNLSAVVICTPQHKHLEHSLAAAERGFHLFIEKPVSDTLEGLEDLISEVKCRSLISHVGANLRFHFGPSTIFNHLQNGSLGRPLWAGLWAGMHLPDWHPDEDYREMYSAKISQGGGAVMDFIHEIDLLLWCFGTPASLAAITGRSNWLEIETEDMVDAIFRYSDGLQVNLHVDYLQRPFQRGIRVVCEAGWIEWDLTEEHVTLYQHEDKSTTVFPYPSGYNHNEMYVEQMKYFINCIQSGRQSASSITEGQKALTLALQIKMSSLEKRFCTGS